MKTRLVILGMLLGLIIACSKDESTPTPDAEPTGPQDFSTPTNYTVTAENGTSRTCLVNRRGGPEPERDSTAYRSILINTFPKYFNYMDNKSKTSI